MTNVNAKNPLLKERILAEDAQADLYAADGRLEDLAGRVVERALERQCGWAVSPLRPTATGGPMS